jgi:hypothetical protein
MAVDYRVVAADASRLDDVEPLWKAMVEHHRMLTEDQLPVRSGDEAWRRRRGAYDSWLSSGRAWLLLAVAGTPQDQAAIGYAVVRR